MYDGFKGDVCAAVAGFVFGVLFFYPWGGF